jgi:hypothetical protein
LPMDISEQFLWKNLDFNTKFRIMLTMPEK